MDILTKQITLLIMSHYTVVTRGAHDPVQPDNPSRPKGYWVGFGFGILTRCIFRAGFGSYFGLA